MFAVCAFFAIALGAFIAGMITAVAPDASDTEGYAFFLYPTASLSVGIPVLVGGTVLGFAGTHLESGRKLGIYAILIGGFVLGPMILFVLSFFLQEWVSALRRG